MRFMNTRIEFISFSINEKETMQKYLNSMSEKGWQAYRIFSACIVFEKSEKEYYYVDLSPGFLRRKVNVVASSLEEQKELYAQFDYHFVGNTQYFVVYKSKEEKDNMHSDYEIEKGAMKRAFQYYLYFDALLRIVMLTFMLFLAFLNYRRNILQLLSSAMMIICILLYLSMIICLSVSVYRRLQEYKKEKEIAFEQTKWRNDKTILVFMYLTMIFFASLLPYGNVASINMWAPLILAELILCILVVNSMSLYHNIKRKGIIIVGVVCMIPLYMVLSSTLSIDKNQSYFVQETNEMYASVNKQESFLMEFEEVRFLSDDKESHSSEYNYTYYESKVKFLDVYLYEQCKEYYANITKEVANINGVKVELCIFDETSFESQQYIFSYENKVLVINVESTNVKEDFEEIVKKIKWT